MALLVKGNKKLDKSILCWSISPIKSCPNCQDCKKSCYANKSYRMWPNVKKCWDSNLEMAHDGSFKGKIIKELATAKNVTAVRIHVAGDFFSQMYLNDWKEIASLFPDINFYSYSKTFHLFDFSELIALENVNVINSITDDNGINFGDEKRVTELLEQGYTICPTAYWKTVICGLDCKICHKESKVAFLVH